MAVRLDIKSRPVGGSDRPWKMGVLGVPDAAAAAASGLTSVPVDDCEESSSMGVPAVDRFCEEVDSDSDRRLRASSSRMQSTGSGNMCIEEDRAAL